MPILTDIDPRIAVKGSRDPLSMVPVWSHVARDAIGNLTTASTSLRDFTITTLGIVLGERAHDLGHDTSALAMFLRWEQLCGYTRAGINKERGFRGTERVYRALESGKRLELSADRGRQILSNQKTYGLWGLYTVPSTDSALLVRDGGRLLPSPATQSHAKHFWWPEIEKAQAGKPDALVALLAKPVIRIDGTEAWQRIQRTIARLIHHRMRSKAEREFYWEHLACGGRKEEPVFQTQSEFASLLQSQDRDPDEALSDRFMRRLAASAARRYGAASQLEARLLDICACEAVLAPANHIFEWLQSQEGRSVGELARDIRRQWRGGVPGIDMASFRALRRHLLTATKSEQSAQRWVDIGDALKKGDYGAVIEHMLAFNKAVMQERGESTPWMEVQRGALKVRFRDVRRELVEREALPMLWRNSYFIPSLRGMVRSLMTATS